MVAADPDRPLPDPAAGSDPSLATRIPPTVTARRRVPIVQLAIVLVMILAGSALFMSGYSLGRRTASDPGTPVSETTAFQPFWDVYHSINDRYAGGTVDREALIQGAIRGMIASLDDPYSAYLTSEEYRQSLQGISGQFEGIGAEIASQAPDGSQGCTPLGPACRLVITNALDGSPAQKAGLKAGDIVVVGRRGLARRPDRGRGARQDPRAEGDRRDADHRARRRAAPIQLAITRDVVQTKEVDSQALAGGTVGYIRLAGFSDAAADEVVKALRAHLAAGRTKLILDLRGNPGGYVTAARKIASQFIASGVRLLGAGRQGQPGPDRCAGRRRRDEPEHPGRGPHRWRQRVGQRDRRRRPPGLEAGDARRPAVVRQGDRPGVAGADRRGRRVQADHRPLAHARQALDPQGRV